MKKVLFVYYTITLIMISLPPMYGQKLDETLKLLEPLTKTTWQSEMEGLNGEGLITSERAWKVIWEGSAIKYTSVTEKLNVVTEGFIFWDYTEQAIGIFTLNNKGRYIQGHIKEEDGKIVMYGYITLSDKRLEFRNTFEFTENGTILDNWYRFEENEWKPGHSVELFKRKE